MKQSLIPFKKLIYSILLLGVFVYIYFQTSQKQPYTELKGITMGTYYSIVYGSKENFQHEIDSILVHYSAAANSYDPSSEISEFNKTGKIVYKSPYLFAMLTKARKVNHVTQGAFEPTLMPLINAWGFGFSNRMEMDSAKVDSLLSLVSFSYVRFDENKAVALKEGVMLDLSALGEGFGIDLIGGFLDKKGIENYKVEIGGEMLCKGLSPSDRLWRIGIENPKYASSGENRLMTIVELKNEALSTSGSYRKYFVDSTGRKQPHIISPITGYPVQHGLLSATIKAKDCVTADAFATSCMVLGLDKAKKLIKRRDDLEAYFIYNREGKLETWKSDGFETIALE